MHACQALTHLKPVGRYEDEKWVMEGKEEEEVGGRGRQREER